MNGTIWKIYLYTDAQQADGKLITSIDLNPKNQAKVQNYKTQHSDTVTADEFIRIKKMSIILAYETPEKQQL